MGRWTSKLIQSGYRPRNGRSAPSGFAHVYHLRRILGAGGTGTVHEALRIGEGARGACALKIFHEAISARPAAVGMALRQVASLRAADAPDLVEMREVGVFRGRLFVEMELLRGAPLSASLAANKMPMAERRGILWSVLQCLAHIHARGGVHGDIKPGNVFLREGGGVKVIDFGWPNAFPSDSAAAMMACVTPAYATPERLAGAPMSASDDVYAVACLIHLVLTGRHPFGGLSGAEACASGVRAPPLHTFLRAQACEAIELALSFDRRERPESVLDFMTQLDGEFG